MFIPDIETNLLEERAAKLDGYAMNLYQATLLMEVVDPAVYAISFDANGICLYPRCQYYLLTRTEKTLISAAYPIPSAWIGYLSRFNLTTAEKWTKFSNMSSRSQSSSLMKQISPKEQVVDFSLNQLLVSLQEYWLDGHHLGVKSMQDVLRSIFKETFLN